MHLHGYRDVSQSRRGGPDGRSSGSRLLAPVAALFFVALTLTSCGNLYNELASYNRGEVDLLVSSFSTAGPALDLLDPDGNVRNDFAVTVDGFVRAVEVLPNGDLFVGGEFTTFNGEAVAGAVSIDRETGALKPGYRLNLIGGGNPGTILGSTLLPDGSLIIVGDWDSIDGFAETPDVARINGDGTVDTTFAFGAFDVSAGYPNQEARAVAYAGGRVYVSGFFDAVGTTSGTKIEADKIFSFRPGDSLSDISPPLVPGGPSDIVESFVPRPDGSVIALGNFSLTIDINGTPTTLSQGVVLRGEEPTGELVMSIPNFNPDVWAGEWIPSFGLLVSAVITAGGDAVAPWLVWYDTTLQPTLTMPLTLDGVGIPVYLSDERIFLHGNFRNPIDSAGTAGPPGMLRMDRNFRIDPSFQGPFTAGETVVAIYPLF